MSLMEITGGGRRRDQTHYATRALPDFSVNIVLTYIVPDSNAILLGNLSLNSEEHLYVGCHLSTYLVLSSYLGSVDVRCDDKGGTWSQQLETANVSLVGKPCYIYERCHVSHLKILRKSETEISRSTETFLTT